MTTTPARKIIDGLLENPEDIAVQGRGVRMTRASLRTVSLLAAKRMQELGIGPGAIVAFSSGDPLVSIAVVLATGILGAAWVPARPTAIKVLGARITHKIQSQDRNTFASSEAIDVESLFRGAADVGPVDPQELGPDRVDLDATWIYSAAFGAGLQRKLFALSHADIAKRAPRFAIVKEPAGRKLACMFDPMGLDFVEISLVALTQNLPIVIGPVPQFWHGAKITDAVGPASRFAEIFTRYPKGDIHVDAHIYGVDWSESVIREVIERYQSVEEIYETRETGPLQRCMLELTPDGIARRDGDIVADVVEVLGADGKACAPGQEGILRVRAAGQTRGYIANDVATAASFVGDAFLPGDIGRFNTDGVVEITGRINDHISVGGRKINANALDLLLASVEGVKDAIVFLVPQDVREDRLTAFLALDAEVDQDAVAMNCRVRLMQMGWKDFVPEKFLFANNLPRTDTGKADRAACTNIVVTARDRSRGRG